MGRALAVLIWLLTLGSVWLFLSGKWWFPPSITEHGPAVDRQFLITIIVVGIAFTAAQVGLGYMVWRYRETAGGERALYSHGNNRLEIIWTIITAAIFIGLAVMGQRVWAALHLNNAPPGSNRVEVVAQQFQWNFHYAGKDGQFGRTDAKFINDDNLNFVGLDGTDPKAKDDVVTTTLVIPVGRPTEFILRSKDVTHSLWIPQTRFKQDLVPGMTIPAYFKPVKAGRFELACAELCGMNHFKMKAYVLVLPEAEYGPLMTLGQDQFLTRVSELAQKYELNALYDENGNKLQQGSY
ncbi:MAG TPA: cytochrome c oxidase subunit II transmembrane domain-containing protein [Pyrinomonadaceae bacterium]|jgi:cytochrome c oxidase subunit 2